MRAAIISLVIIILLSALTVTNSLTLRHITEGYIKKISDFPDTGEAFESYAALYDEFISDERYISLTVNHEDLREVEREFAEIIAAAKNHDADGIGAAKSRLVDALGHLGRLCGINIDSIL